MSTTKSNEHFHLCKVDEDNIILSEKKISCIHCLQFHGLICQTPTSLTKLLFLFSHWLESQHLYVSFIKKMSTIVLSLGN
jgi:hypothetical protein